MKHRPVDARLESILNALEADLIAVTDAEIADALVDLGFKPGMKGSAVFADMAGKPSGAERVTRERGETHTRNATPAPVTRSHPKGNK